MVVQITMGQRKSRPIISAEVSPSEPARLDDLAKRMSESAGRHISRSELVRLFISEGLLRHGAQERTHDGRREAIHRAVLKLEQDLWRTMDELSLQTVADPG